MKRISLAVMFLLLVTSVSMAAATLQVYAAVNQPTSYLAFPNATRVGFIRIFLRNPGSVPIKAKLKVQQNLLEDWVFRSVVLLDDSYNQIGATRVLDAERQAVIGESLEILPGTSKPVIVAGNMDSDLTASAGKYVRLDVVGVETDAIVDTLIPITDGTAHLINATFVLGTATAYLSVFDPMTAQTVQAGTKNRRFSGIRVIAGSAERIRLRSVVFTQTISLENGLTPAKISNAEVVVDGVHFPTTIARNIDVVHYPATVRRDRYTAHFGQGVVIDKGFSKDVYIQGDLDDSAQTRLLKMDIFSDLDVYATGETYGYGVRVYEGNSSFGRIDYSSRFPQGSNPWFYGSLLTVEANVSPSSGGGGGVVIQPPSEPRPPSVLPGQEIVLQEAPWYRRGELPSGGTGWWCFVRLVKPLPENVVVWWDSNWSGQYSVPVVGVNGDGTLIGFPLLFQVSHLLEERLQEIGRVRIFEIPSP